MSRVVINFLLIIFILSACNGLHHADMILRNGTIFSVDSVNTTYQVMIIEDGKIKEMGGPDLLMTYDADTIIDLNGKYVYPGLIDAHSHFYGLGQSTINIDLTGTKSWDQVIINCDEFVSTMNPIFLLGRGWDQNAWEKKEYPVNDLLNEHFPSIPVLLKRVDGHAAIANNLALHLAGITTATKIEGGEIIQKDGKLTGVLIDNAVDLIEKALPPIPRQIQIKGIYNAEKICVSYGLTTVSDAGLDKDIIQLIDSLHRFGGLNIKVNTMISATPENLNLWFKQGPVITKKLRAASFKMYADGALGSRGACLIEPYTDQVTHTGFLLTPPDQMEKIVKQVAESNFQLCTHCIGDSANRFVLDLYGKYLQNRIDRRWRIEHAQVVDQKDVYKFKTYGIIPSMQPVHATSDMYWAGIRLGNTRVKNAYALKTLMNQNGWIALGTDFPVESPNTWHTFYAATERKDNSIFPSNGFQVENKLTRLEALRGMTSWAARADFEENDRGSLEKGKSADFIITPINLLEDNAEKIRDNKEVITYIDGKRVYPN